MITEAVQLMLPLGHTLTTDQRTDLTRLASGLQADRAACRDGNPDDWHPDPDDPDSAAKAARAARTCAGCPVARACLSAALVADEQGIWGGTTEGQRADLLDLIGTGVRVEAVLSIATDRPRLAA
ncbi:WhiB family transcriptional regulator [Microlunatus speluncae]|uniref:WhiB family transcriptional regulator n=1 Tax=Microlunatus speluncae TaxID=2594267 RepID=UPI001C2D3A77|nr:WhiB family transcriptional regulator [Microlunatus speluncae]